MDLRLFMINMAGNLLKSSLYLIFTSMALSGYTFSDRSAECQMAGYFLSIANEVTGKLS
jgi:hypothetical protein